MEFGLNHQLIQFFIEQARVYHAQENLLNQEEVIDNITHDFMPGSNKNYANLIYHDAIATVNKLEPEQQAALVALMYVGRGDYDISEWEDALAVAKNYWTMQTGEYLLSRPLVADYLEEGLEQLGDDA